jgi:hypothetical protein
MLIITNMFQTFKFLTSNLSVSIASICRPKAMHPRAKTEFQRPNVYPKGITKNYLPSSTG